MENIIVPLPGFSLPKNLPWTVGFVALVNDQLKKLRCTGQYIPQRFFGYYKKKGMPIGVCGSWTVVLDESALRPEFTSVERMSRSDYRIEADREDVDPDYILIHDRLTSQCWLWSFFHGLRFIEAYEPVENVPGDTEESDLSKPQ